MTGNAIELEAVSKLYEKVDFKKRVINVLRLRGIAGEKVTALDKVSLKVGRGEIFGLLGPNGAGKTTMIKILTTILAPDSGKAYVDGYNVVTDSLKVRARIGVLYEESDRGFGWRLSAWTNLLFYSREYLVDDPKERVEEVLRMVELTGDDTYKWFQKLSKGMKQKVALARALIPNSQVLFLDEPQRSLDILFVLRLKELIKGKFGKPSRTIFLSTHDMRLVEETCDRVAIIDKGRIVKVGTVDELKSLFRSLESVPYTLEVASDPAGSFDKLSQEIASIEGVEEAKLMNPIRLEIHIRKDRLDALNNIIGIVMDRGYTVTGLTQKEDSLEESIARILRGGELES